MPARPNPADLERDPVVQFAVLVRSLQREDYSAAEQATAQLRRAGFDVRRVNREVNMPDEVPVVLIDPLLQGHRGPAPGTTGVLRYSSGTRMPFVVTASRDGLSHFESGPLEVDRAFREHPLVKDATEAGFKIKFV